MTDGACIPNAALMQMASGYWVSKALFVAAKLGIADLLAERPATATELARRCNAEPRALHRVLRALAGNGVFREVEGERFELTPLALPLRSDHPASLRNWVIMINDTCFAAWSEFLHSVQTGAPAFDKVFGVKVFEHFARDAEAGATFQRAMEETYRPEGPLIAENWDFASVRHVMDVGGGNGALLSAILTRYPHLTGTLVDLDFAISAAGAGAGGPLPRCEFVVGDFFRPLPRGADLITLKHVIHDWDDASACTVLANCRAALAPGGRILVLDAVVPEGNASSPVKWLDLMMLAVPGGQERSEAEFRALFRRADLHLASTTILLPDLSILQATPAAD